MARIFHDTRTRDVFASVSDHARRMVRPESIRFADGFLARYGVLILMVLAGFYYGQYYRSELNLGGEGGTTAVIAMRLIEGQKPFVDSYLGYNVMWFYPVVALFGVTGPDFVALRLYFFALALANGILGFLIVRRVTGHGWLAVGTGALMILIPGMIFRNYMGLLPVLNAWVILNAYVLESARCRVRWIWFVAAGLTLGLTYLIRVDLGHFFLVIYLGAIGLFPFGIKGHLWRRVPVALAAFVLLLGGIGLTHFPVWRDAQARGFATEFLNQYTNQISYLRYEIETKILGRRNSAVVTPPLMQPRPDPGPSDPSMWIRVRSDASAPVPENGRDSDPGAVAVPEEVDRHTRPREHLLELFEQESFYDAAFVLVLHLPVGIAGIVIVVGGAGLLGSLATGNGQRKAACLTCLITTGAALTLFPQYFFFRPDTPHVSEFMCPFLVAMVCAATFAFRWSRRSGNLAVRVGCTAFILLCGLQQTLYFYHSFPKESSGSIAAKRKRSHEFVAENGVRVFVKRREAEDLRGLFAAIMRHSDPDDWLITYPYSPTINFMTNRRSYLYNLYVDNATAHRDFAGRAREEIEFFQPAVIVVDDRPINNTDYSRFSNWAASTLAFIASTYVNVGTFKTNTVFVRPDKINSGVAPES